MKVRVDGDARFSDVVPIGKVQEGLLYRYDFRPGGKPSTVYLIATSTSTHGRLFVGIEDGALYNGDLGELRLIERAEFYIGKRPE